MQQILKFILPWGFSWLLVYGAFNFYLRPKIVGSIEQAMLLVSYFSFFSFILAVGLKKYCGHQFNKKKFIALVLIFLVYICVSLVIDNLFPIDKAKLHTITDMGLHFPNLDIKVLMYKSADVLFQQFMMLFFISYLKDRFVLSPHQISIYMGVSFFLLHLPLLSQMSIGAALLIIIPCSFAGYLFARLIFKNGIFILYSTMLHLFFYSVAAIFVRYFF